MIEVIVRKTENVVKSSSNRVRFQACACLALIAAASLPLPGFTTKALAQQEGQQQPVLPVGTITLKETAVPYSVTLPGRAVAYEQADIRPRVEGMITSIPYDYGSEVDRGTILFQIEPDTYEAELAAAEADVASAQAQIQTAQSTYDRYQQIKGVGVTQTTLEEAAATLASSKAQLKSAQSALKTARLNLDRTSIQSPIHGVVEVPEVSVGTLVTANQTDILTTVTRLDPIYVDVSESSAQMQRGLDLIRNGTLVLNDTINAELTLETGEAYTMTGKLISPSAVVSAATGSVDYRIQFDNPDRKILPGQFLRATITPGQTKAILVPQNATSRDSAGTLTAYIVDKDGAAAQSTLTTRGTFNNQWVVTNGLEAGDQLIVDNLMKLSPGAKVRAVPVTIDKDGVVQDREDMQATDESAAQDADGSGNTDAGTAPATTSGE
ncbi:efflux RND transporter periplasmic adaptor subunit [Rhodobacteraceae bacterium]|nr:efflux RND transporter periplasmic adaptor subunit [Paracoccaceae bacterium]